MSNSARRTNDACWAVRAIIKKQCWATSRGCSRTTRAKGHVGEDLQSNSQPGLKPKLLNISLPRCLDCAVSIAKEMAPVILHSDPPPLSRHILAFLRRRPAQTAFLSSALILLILFRIEWAYFVPRLILSSSSYTPPDEDSLPIRIAASEERYQASLRARQELIRRVGPETSAIEAYVRVHRPITRSKTALNLMLSGVDGRGTCRCTQYGTSSRQPSTVRISWNG